MDHAKLLDVVTSLPISHSILPCAVCFATSRPANHAICSYIDSSGYASWPIRRFLFIDYIINVIYDFYFLDLIFKKCIYHTHKLYICNRSDQSSSGLIMAVSLFQTV